MLADSPPGVDGKPSANGKAKNGRARATNHRDLLPHIADGRLPQARRFRDLVRAMIADAGGVEYCSEIRIGLIRRLAAATVLSEDIEAKAVNGEIIDIAIFCQLASTTVRLAQRLGVERIPRDVGDGLTPLQRHLARIKQLEHQARPQGNGAAP